MKSSCAAVSSLFFPMIAWITIPRFYRGGGGGNTEETNPPVRLKLGLIIVPTRCLALKLWSMSTLNSLHANQTVALHNCGKSTVLNYGFPDLQSQGM